MNIGIVCYPTFGGSGVVATELGKALADLGHNIHFIATSQPARLDAFSQNIFYHEVSFAEYPLFKYAPYESALAGKIVDVALYEKLDILHVHYAIPHAATGFMAKQILASKGYHLPVVTTLHGTDITLVGKDPALRPVVTFSIDNSDAVTAVSHSLKQDTIDNFGIQQSIEVIPNFIDFKRFSKTNKDHFKQLIAPNNEKVIVHISNFRKVKRVKDVIQMFHILNKEMPAKLLMVGDGPERQGAELLCRELGDCADIRFLGKQEKVEEILAIADVFVLPSESESFGLAALEAMACQVPVISSNAGGLAEVNIHGETGFLAKVGDYESMAAFAIDMLKNPSQHQQFKENALARAKQFDIQNIISLYENVYQEVKNGKAQIV